MCIRDRAFTTIFTDMYKMPPNKYRENERFYPLLMRFRFEGSYACLLYTSMAILGLLPAYARTEGAIWLNGQNLLSLDSRARKSVV